jgi:glycosyltransferase involved in cell wall biosynthesis
MPGHVSVSVVMPAKNRAGVIERALRSVQAQTVPVDEIIVVDDGSTDDTVARARALGATVLEHGTSQGSGAARNTGVRAARGTWIAFLDSDDEWLPNHLEYVLPHLPGHVLVSASAVDTNGRGLGNTSGRPVPLDPPRIFVPEPPVVTSAALAERSELLAAGLFGTFPRVQDGDMWARLLERGPGLVLPEPTVVYDAPPGPTDTAVVARNRAALRDVVESLSDRPWMTRRLRVRIRARHRWDDMRRAMSHRDVRGTARDAAWLTAHPSSWPTLVQLVALRRAAREQRWGRALARRLSTRTPDAG